MLMCGLSIGVRKWGSFCEILPRLVGKIEVVEKPRGFEGI